jgi:prepilin-type N-terminal cleavage/methylation domain-containing protein
MRRAFTLIELLIVVAIIAILAAIAVPNFLEAQTRAKVSRVKTDMRSIATAFETYRLDNSGYPEYAVIITPPGTEVQDPAVVHGQDYFECFSRVAGLCITTPIAYLATIPPDIFAVGRFAGPEPQVWDISYKNSRQNSRIFSGDRASEPWLGPNGEKLLKDWGEWRLSSGGPDGTRIDDIKKNLIYDTSNGTLSKGDIVRSQRNAESVPK